MLNTRYLEKIKEKIETGENTLRSESANREFIRALRAGRADFCICYDGFGIVGDTIIVYEGPSKHLHIPAKIQGHHIKRVGAGALCGNENLLSLEIEEGIEEIGENAFAQCRNLQSLSLPGSLQLVEKGAFPERCGWKKISLTRRMSHSMYEQLVREGIALSDRRTLIDRKGLSEIGLEKFYKLTGMFANGAVMISESMGLLFCEYDNQWQILSLNGTPVVASEDAGVRYKIESGVQEPFSEEAEIHNDRMVRQERKLKPKPGRVQLAIVDCPNVRRIQGDCLVPIQILSGLAFWQSVRKVIVDGNDYYVYRREYLTSNANCPFFVENADVFTESGRLRDGEEKSLIMKKYIFLSMFE